MRPRQRIRLAVPTHPDTIQHLLIPIAPLAKPFHLIPFRRQVHRRIALRRPGVPKDEIINLNLRQWTQQNNREQPQLRRQSADSETYTSSIVENRSPFTPTPRFMSEPSAFRFMTSSVSSYFLNARERY